MASSSVWRAAACLGGAMGLSNGLSFGLIWGLSAGLLSNSLSFGLSASAAVILTNVILGRSTGALHLTERISWRWNHAFHRGHLRVSLTIMGILFFFGLSSGLSLGLSSGASGGLSDLLVAGPQNGLSLGLSDALSVGLSYLILLGLYRGIAQEHLEDQSRQQFNQGVRRSLLNGFHLALISTSIITILGVVSFWLRRGLGFMLSDVLGLVLVFGLSGGLQRGVSDALRVGLGNGPRVGLVLFSTSLVIMWVLSGGLTILRHYVIRWLLARHHIFPFHAQAFLDDATTRILLRRVGGGYSFIHRRLQDYFASAAVPPPQE